MSCLLLVLDQVSTEMKSNYLETIEKCGTVVLCVLKLIIKN